MQQSHTPYIRLSSIILGLAIYTMAAVVLTLCILALPAMWRAVPQEYPDHTYVFYCLILALYLASIPFFIVLWQALRLLQLIKSGAGFSLLSVTALKRISWCAISISIIFAAAMPFFYMWAQGDDAPGLLVISLFLVLAPFAIAIFAGLLQQVFAEAIAIKTENELTV